MKPRPVLSTVPEEKGQGLQVVWTNGNGITRKCGVFVDEEDSPLLVAKRLMELAGHILDEVTVDIEKGGF